jgi:hypothetical protein
MVQRANVMITDDQINEMLEINEYDFTEDGKRY